MKPMQLVNDWKENLEGVKAAFFESMQGGFPKAEAVEVEAPAVLCEHYEVKFREVKLYFLHRHVKMKFQECDCKPLWKTLMLLQFMPASIRQPKCAVHFGFLQAIHDRKVIGQDSVTSWVEWMNLQNSRRADSDSGEELMSLGQDVLNKCYLIYCRLLLSIERTLEEEFAQSLDGITLAPSCVVCLGSERTMITMDGNFSQKRHNCAHNSPEPFLVDQVDELWSKAKDVEKFLKDDRPVSDC
ncbi:uncharacterized protein EV154DRAFT_508526, partial [Mucor mucedo]|uniref:uncharacterized protein n=1 Tax=Mucor mucedo TaxID=29922 RepID=UPI00221E4182